MQLAKANHSKLVGSLVSIKRKQVKEMIKTTLKIDGMMCGMCEAHICDTIRKVAPSAKKVAASRSKKEASFLTEEAVDAERIKAAVDETGYSCLSVESIPYEKKGLFGKK